MEPRAGCRLPVRVEQVVNGALLVTVSYGQRSFAGILLDCTKKYGLFGLPPPTPLSQADGSPVNGCQGPAATEEDPAPMQLGSGPPPPTPPPCPEPLQALLTPLPTGSLSLLQPYFEGAPFPPPLWLRSTYQQWVPQPPPRPIKRTRRRLSRSGSRNSDSGQLTLSPICLRPRRVLCEKCKSTLNAPEAGPAPSPVPRPRRRLGSGDPDREPRKQGSREGKGAPTPAPAPAPARRSKRERREEELARVPRSPAIRISYSTPQGAGEVVQIPPRVHGSLEPFQPPQAQRGAQEPRAARDRPPDGPSAPVPKLKLTRPVPPGADLLPPKIRLKPHRLGAGAQQQPVYRAELVEELNGLGRGPPAPAPPAPPAPAHIVLVELSSGSSEEEDEAQAPRRPQGDRAGCPGATATSAGASVCSSDSPDESKSPGSEVTSPDACDPPAGDSGSAAAAPTPAGPTVPPLTVRLHTQSLSTCAAEDGRTVAVGDIVWGHR
ncbi:PWWP domain containing 2B [Phyllostomus discolor]|uniref:PWWP domain containing 2B n=1 Tax=Phyllostomus discolor TaxID=89673 RepID=A0A834AER0_9CHIR|nr:PWWP domain containing 2B [Phyllostomus discolor]